MHALPHAGITGEVRGHLLGDRQQHRGTAESALRHPLRARAVQERPVLCLLLDERRIHLEEPRDAPRAGVLHPREAPERVAFVDDVEGSRALERGNEAAVGAESRSFAGGEVAAGQAGELVDAQRT